MDLANPDHDGARMIMKQRKWLLLGGVTLAACLLAATPRLAAQDRRGEPFVVTSQVGSATPFHLVLPSTTASGRRVKTVEIEFVTSDCVIAAGATIIGAAKVGVKFDGGFAIYTLGFEAPLSFQNLAEFTSARKTLIFADPGSRLTYGLSGAQPSCTVVFSGHLIPQER